MTQKPEVILFDFWLTLGTSLSEDPIATFWRQLGFAGNPSDEFMTACLTTKTARPKRFVDQIARRFGVIPTPQNYRDFRELVKSERKHLRMFEETLSTLESLRNAGYKMGVISNLWAFPANAIFKRHKLDAFFEHKILSFECGVRKPASAIFELACTAFGVTPERCLMVGDSPSSDIAGAASVGMPAVLIARTQTAPNALPANTRVIKSLSALCA